MSKSALSIQAWHSAWEAWRDDIEDGVMDMIVEEPAETVENRTAMRAGTVTVWKRMFFFARECILWRKEKKARNLFFLMLREMRFLNISDFSVRHGVTN